jgi:hypothetical protein
VKTAQDLIDQWRLHPSPEVGSCANQLAGWLMKQEKEKALARGGNQAVSQHLQSSAAETGGLSATAPEESERRCGGTGMVAYWDGSAYAGEMCRGCIDCEAPEEGE